MKLTELHIKDYNQFEDFKLDLTYPEGHRKAGQALDKVCFIGQSGTGKTSLIEILNEGLRFIANLSHHALRDREFPTTSSFITNRQDVLINGLKLCLNNDLIALFDRLNDDDFIKDDGKSFWSKINGVNQNTVDFLKNEFQLFFYPCDMIYPKAGELTTGSVEENKYVFKNHHDFSKYDLQSSWATINNAIIKDRELEIKKSLEISKLLQNPTISQEEVLKARSEFLAWRKSSPNPLVNLAKNYLDRILNRFNLKVKTELDFERKEDIETIKIQTRQGADIPFEGLSTGTKQVILTALPLYGLKPENAIILFDEPERSLYPDIQKEIVDFYTSMAKDSQFFFATHSPLIASSFAPWEIVELKFNERGKVYQEKYYEGEKHVDNYTINPQYLTWTGILQKVFDLEQESNPLRDRQLIELATLESKLKHNSLTPEKKKETFEKYQKLATLLNWELK